MAKVPAERFQSATELADALAGHLDEPTQPSRTSLRPAANPTARRPLYGRPLGVVASTLGLIAIAIGFLSWWRFHPGDSSDLSGIPVAIPPVPSSPPDRPSPQERREVAKAVSRSGHVQNFLQPSQRSGQEGRAERALELYDEAIRHNGENTAALLARASILSSYAIANWSGASRTQLKQFGSNRRTPMRMS